MRFPMLIFGGTFDPPHRAHTELPALVAEELSCERIIYVPTSQNPLKHERPAPAEHRYEMLRIALRGHERAVIDATELQEQGPSYTVDTLERLNRQLGAQSPRDLRLLMGSDAASSFYRWKQPQRILELATPAVMLRPPLTREAFLEALSEQAGPEEAERWSRWIVDTPEIDISATELREALARGEDVPDLVDPDVLAYIRRHGLYQRRPGDAPEGDDESSASRG